MYNKKQEEKARTKISLDKVDLCKKYKWTLEKYYIVTEINGKKLKLHRLLMNAKKGDIVDHINRDKLDNRNENLRFCTKSQNIVNSDMQKNNTSGVKGIDYLKKKKLWRVRIAINNKKIYIGSFKNFEDAIKARQEAELKYFGEFSPLYKDLLCQYKGGETMDDQNSL